MSVTKLTVKCLLVCAISAFIVNCIYMLTSISLSGVPEPCQCEKWPHESVYKKDHLLAVIVPFRDRFDELMEFAPHIHSFLNAQKIQHKIYVINQVDQYRFNRASLINVGFRIAESENCDYLAMHDVDLLPLNPQLSYAFPEHGLFHVASPELHPKYHYQSFVGGILIITTKDFVLVNGMSNKYWGWGLEDDEFYVRLKQSGLNITRPTNLTTGVDNTFRHIHDKVRRKRDMVKCHNQKEMTRRRDRITGLRDVQYTIQSRRSLLIDGVPLTVINTELRCNRTFTPWCLCSEEKKTTKLSSISNAAKKKTKR